MVARVAQLLPPQLPLDGSGTRPRRRMVSQKHPLLKSFKELMAAAGESHSGFLKPKKHLLVDVITSKESLDRAIHVANHLFLSFEKRGHEVVIVPHGQNLQRHDIDEREKGGRRNERYYSDIWSPWRPTVAFIGTVGFGVTIFELSENVEVQYHDGKYIRVSELPAKNSRRYELSSWRRSTHDLPSKRFCVQVFSPYPRVTWMRQWREKKIGEFPRKLAGLVQELEDEAANIVGLFEEGERQTEIERQRFEEEKRARAREEAERLRLKAIMESKEELSGIIEAWANAKRIEEFFAEIEWRVASLKEEQKSVIQERLMLARKMIDSTNALTWLTSWKTPEERNSELNSK